MASGRISFIETLSQRMVYLFFAADFADLLLGLKLQNRSIRRMLQRKHQQVGNLKGSCPQILISIIVPHFIEKM